MRIIASTEPAVVPEAPPAEPKPKEVPAPNYDPPEPNKAPDPNPPELPTCYSEAAPAGEGLDFTPDWSKGLVMPKVSISSRST